MLRKLLGASALTLLLLASSAMAQSAGSAKNEIMEFAANWDAAINNRTSAAAAATAAAQSIPNTAPSQAKEAKE